MAPGHAAATEPSTVGNLHHEASRDLAVRVPDAHVNLAMLAPAHAAVGVIHAYPERVMKKATIQLFSDLPLIDLQTDAFAAPFSHHQVIKDVNQKQAGLGVTDESSWIMFSW